MTTAKLLSCAFAVAFATSFSQPELEKAYVDIVRTAVSSGISLSALEEAHEAGTPFDLAPGGSAEISQANRALSELKNYLHENGELSKRMNRALLDRLGELIDVIGGEGKKQERARKNEAGHLHPYREVDLGDDEAISVDLSANHVAFATKKENRPRLYSASDLNLIRTFPKVKGAIYDLHFSWEGNHLNCLSEWQWAVMAGGAPIMYTAVYKYDTRNLEKIFEDEGNTRPRHTEPGRAGNSIELNGDLSLSVSRWEGKFSFYQSSNGRILHSVRAHQGRILSWGVDQDKKNIITSGSDHKVRLWDIEQIWQEAGIGVR